MLSRQTIAHNMIWLLYLLVYLNACTISTERSQGLRICSMVELVIPHLINTIYDLMVTASVRTPVVGVVSGSSCLVFHVNYSL